MSHAAALEKHAGSALHTSSGKLADKLARANSAADEQRGIADVVDELWGPFASDATAGLRTQSDGLDSAVSGVRALTGDAQPGRLARMAPSYKLARRTAMSELNSRLAQAEELGRSATAVFEGLARNEMVPRSRQAWDHTELLVQRHLGMQALVKGGSNEPAQSLADAVENASMAAYPDPAARVARNQYRMSGQAIEEYRVGRQPLDDSTKPYSLHTQQRDLWSEALLAKSTRGGEDGFGKALRAAEADTWSAIKKGFTDNDEASDWTVLPDVVRIRSAGTAVQQRAAALTQERWRPEVTEVVEAAESRAAALHATADEAISGLQKRSQDLDEAVVRSDTAERELADVFRSGSRDGNDPAVTAAMDRSGAAFTDEALAVNRLDRALGSMPGATPISETKYWNLHRILNEAQAPS